ncbi:MAG: tetratricopeptide repeat protein [Bacteroidia bacterium]|nr:tetratricopeptide repeat protein [Bacteroidia bacterium]
MVDANLFNYNFGFIKWILHTLFVLSILSAVSQNKAETSTYEIIVESAPDTIKVNSYCRNFKGAISKRDFLNAELFFDKALELCEKNNFKAGINSLIDIIHFQAIGAGYYKQAINFLFKVKEASIRMNYNIGVSGSINEIGIIYWRQNDTKQALYFYTENINYINKHKVKANLSAAYNNVGLALRQLNKYDMAVEYYNKSLQMCLESGDMECQANAYNNIGTIYQFKHDYEKAIEFHNKSLELRLQIADSIGISMSLGNLGWVLLEQKKFKDAEIYFHQSLGVSRRANDPEGIQEICEGLSKLYEETNQTDKALSYYKEFIATRDTLMNEEVKKELLVKEMQFRYDQEEEKREMEVKSEKMRQQLYTLMALLILFIALVFSLLLFKRFKLTQKQKDVIEKQKKLVEEKQTEITDSIQYAKRIQTTLLAHKEFLNKNLPEYFVYYRPKDIVSGDFYWATHAEIPNHNEEGSFYLAVCDSTGHGVPGAFMSLLNITFLNEAINEKGIYQPNEVFNHVRKRLIESISQDGGQEGMDAILVQFNKKDLSINYAAANNPPVVVRNKEVIELPYDKLPVGQSESESQFNNYSFQLQKDDMLYLFTDGYADQFGGPKSKKFMYHRLNELFVSLHHLPVSKQQAALADTFENWKGTLDQIDDVCIIGIRI